MAGGEEPLPTPLSSARIVTHPDDVQWWEGRLCQNRQRGTATTDGGYNSWRSEETKSSSSSCSRIPTLWATGGIYGSDTRESYCEMRPATFHRGSRVQVLRSDGSYSTATVTAAHVTALGPHYDVRVAGGASKSGVPENEVADAGSEDAIIYVYGGHRYSSLEVFLAAVAAGSASRRHPPPHELTSDAVAARVRGLFVTYCGCDRLLEACEFRGLAASVAADLGMDPRRFGDLSDTFDRFDINGDGLLDEEECVMLAESMLRHYVDALSPRRPGEVSMLKLDFKSLEDHYELSEKLGQGGQGVVYLAREKSSGLQRVVKCFDKENANAPLSEIELEFRILRGLDHPKIQRLYDIFEDRSNVYIISEPYYGGPLGDLIERAFEAGRHVTSAYLAKVLFQVLQGVAYLHGKYITHCDLKESNVMIATDADWQDPAAVVIDFGLAHNFVTRGTSGGTPGYMPPEVWARGHWTPKGDVHALGVIFYQMFSNGDRCYPGWDDDTIKAATLNSMPNMSAVTEAWRRCNDLPPLLEQMLRKDPSGRPTAKECMEHSFFVKRVHPEPDPDDEAEDPISPEIVASLSGTGEKSRLQQAILTDMAARMNLAELRELNDVFNRMDADGNGVLTADEARAALGKSMTGEALEQAVARLVGPNGMVAYTAFMGRLVASKAADENRLLWREFQQLDTNGTGYLGKAQIAVLLDRPTLAQIIGSRGPSQLMDLMDADGDGRVVFEEFRAAIGSCAL